MRAEMVIRFRDKLQKMPSGWSPGGAVFPDSIVLSVDEATNSLRIVAPTTVEREQGTIEMNCEDGTKIVMAEEKVLQMDYK